MLFKRYRVVFSGEFDQSKTIDEIKANLSKRFSLKPSVLERLLAGRPVVVKNEINAETAYRYKQAIDEAGALSRIEEVPEVDDIDEYGFVERRKTERRFNNERRKHFRAESIQPDRRKKERRRNWPPPPEIAEE